MDKRIDDDEVLYEVSEHIATITLNAPDRMNTISGPMLRALSDYLLEADRDPQVRCIILTGKGRAFCAGLDLKLQTSGQQSVGESGVSATDIDLRSAPPTVLHDINTPITSPSDGSGHASCTSCCTCSTCQGAMPVAARTAGSPSQKPGLPGGPIPTASGNSITTSMPSGASAAAKKALLAARSRTVMPT